MLRKFVLKKALESYHKHYDKIPRKDAPYFVIVDYTLRSNKKRLFFYARILNQVLKEHHVAHGSGSSDPSDPGKAIKFSNKVGSRCSSEGAAITGSVYYGRYGRSLNLKGLEDTNSNMYIRRVVLHKSDYVTDEYIAKVGRCGQSWGCLAVDPAIKDSLIDLIKDGSFVYLYGG